MRTSCLKAGSAFAHSHPFQCCSDGLDEFRRDLLPPQGVEVPAVVRIRRNEGPGGHTPIVALTAHALPNYGLRCLAAGMDGYLAKPLKMSELLAIIQRVALSRSEPLPDDSPVG